MNAFTTEATAPDPAGAPTTDRYDEDYCGGDVDGLTAKCPACGNWGEYPDCSYCGQVFNEPVQAIRGVELCSGFGQKHTNKYGKPLATINWQRITQMVDTPQTGIEKAEGQWLIPSTASSRLASEHEKHGQYWVLWFDCDHNPHGIDVLEESTELSVGSVDYEIYSTRSAKPENHKARVLIPLEASLSASDWRICQDILNESLDGFGFKPDVSSKKLAQLLFLPNRGAIYEKRSRREGNHFQPLNVWAEQIAAKRNELAQAEAEVMARKATAQAARASLKAEQVGQDDESLIRAFNSAYSPEEILERNSYDRRGNTFRHPASESGSFSASVKMDAKGVMRVHSLSTADPLYTGGKGGGARDAFDVFCKLEHGGNRNAAIIDAGDNLLKIGSESWNKVKRREYMRLKEAEKLASVDISGLLAKAGITVTPEQAGTPPPKPKSTEQATEGTPPPGQDATEQTTAGTSYPLSIVWANDLPSEFTPPDEIVEGLLTAGDISMFYGDSNSGKTFLAIDLCASVARGVPWQGLSVEQGIVVYLAAESPSSVQSRLQAYQLHHRCRVPNFCIVKNPIDLFDGAGDTNKIIQLVHQIEAERDQKVLLIVGDTLARLSAGANENAGQDMGVVVRHLDRIKTECKAHIAIIHHCGKAQANGARGWSGIRAAIDTEIEVTDTPAGRVAEITKQRDLPTKGKRIGFRLEPVTLGLSKWGTPSTSCIVVSEDAPAQQPLKRMGEVEGAVVEFLAERKVGIRKAEVAKHFEERYQRPNVYRAIKALVTAQAIHEAAGMVCIATAAK